jgi:hypothetical protein
MERNSSNSTSLSPSVSRSSISFKISSADLSNPSATIAFFNSLGLLD